MPIVTIPRKPTGNLRIPLERSWHVLNYTHKTCTSLLNVFTTIRGRTPRGGAPRDEEQDILRSMLVFSGAGLDSVVKHLIRESLPKILEIDGGAQNKFEKFIQTSLKADPIGDIPEKVNVKFIAQVISKPNPRDVCIEYLTRSLTSGSLQSCEELKKASSYFSIEVPLLNTSRDKIKFAFDIRNKIIHELDMDFTQPNRNRFPRRRDDMVEYSGLLLNVGIEIYQAVLAKLQSD